MLNIPGKPIYYIPYIKEEHRIGEKKHRKKAV
jgi:hypothetical protein